MTTITAVTKTALMHIIRPMTAVALLRQLAVLFQRDPMTSLADKLSMFTLQWIICLGIVIKSPQQPTVWIVAIATLFTHAALVLIIRLVAGDTLDIRILKLRAQMA